MQFTGAVQAHCIIIIIIIIIITKCLYTRLAVCIGSTGTMHTANAAPCRQLIIGSRSSWVEILCPALFVHLNLKKTFKTLYSSLDWTMYVSTWNTMAYSSVPLLLLLFYVIDAVLMDLYFFQGTDQWFRLVCSSYQVWHLYCNFQV